MAANQLVATVKRLLDRFNIRVEITLDEDGDPTMKGDEQK